jgi:hypothetical protein
MIERSPEDSERRAILERLEAAPRERVRYLELRTSFGGEAGADDLAVEAAEFAR